MCSNPGGTAVRFWNLVVPEVGLVTQTSGIFYLTGEGRISEKVRKEEAQSVVKSRRERAKRFLFDKESRREKGVKQ